MPLNEDRFIEIVEAVEAVGGELIPETHVGYEIPYEIKGRHGRTTKRPAQSTACGAEAIVEIPYILPITRDKDGKVIDMPDEIEIETPMRVCILDDRLDLWPRFAKGA